jgi:hypothetical protein
MSKPFSKAQFKLYEALRKRRDWISSPDLIKRGIGGSTSTRRTLREWHLAGIVDRRRNGHHYFYRWSPKKQALLLVAEMERHAKEWRASARITPNPATQALRALAALFLAAAKAAETQR